GPDGSTFVLNNWNYSGIDALDGAATNATAVNPVPIQTYTDTTGGGGPDATVILQNLAFTPRDLTIEVGQTVRFTNVENNVEHNVNGSLEDYPCNPFGFFSGAAADGPWDFDLTFNLAGFYEYQCDPHVDFDMFGTITVVDPNEPIYFDDAIGNVTDEDANGVALSLKTPVTLTGVVYGSNLRPPGLLFNIIDQQGDGITVFKDAADCYEVTEGDEVSVAGTITQFNGLTQLTVAKQVEVNSSGNALAAPALVTVPLSEETEGKFVRIEDVMVDSIIQTGGSGWNIFGTNSHGSYVIRLDSDVFSDAPYEGKVISVNGLGGQFDSSEPFTDGYQLLPRGPADIEETLSTTELPVDAVEMFPNPAGNQLFFKTDLPIDEIRLFDLTGALIQVVSGVNHRVALNTVIPGIYLVRVITGEGAWTGRLIKQ
ncbi:MAG: T9SS type A sorting domain-containing protein, partial [Saprospiraceae bacterium]|nr:T9SS type A sorting domain-containing protein [Saprospiraceae bacterium]